jgi:hypothetical protein
MQVNGMQPLGLHTPGMQVDGLHDACACALLSVIVANMAGAEYAAALRKCRRARSSSFDSPASSFMTASATVPSASRTVYPESERRAWAPICVILGKL